MKKTILISCFLLLGLSSCKKNWECECTTTDPIVGPIVTKNEIKNETAKNAEKICNDIEEAGGASASCKLIGFK